MRQHPDDREHSEVIDSAASTTPSDEEVGNQRRDTGGTSVKQIRANRRNAKKSTGPKTEAGKARSSQNARKHGIFLTAVLPVTDGSVAEEPEEFFDRVMGLVEAMHPRDALEWEVAMRRAGILVKLERLDRWGASSIADAAVMRPADIKAGARSEVRVRMLERVAEAVHRYLDDPARVEDPNFSVMATFLRFHGPTPEVMIDGFWDEQNTPSTDEDWKRAFEALRDAFWDDRESATSWAMGKFIEISREFEQVEKLEERLAANRILSGPFDLQLRYEARLLSSLRVIGKEYAELQKRDLVG